MKKDLSDQPNNIENNNTNSFYCKGFPFNVKYFLTYLSYIFGMPWAY